MISQEVHKRSNCLTALDDRIGLLGGITAYLGERASIHMVNCVTSIAKKIYNFIKNNWKPLLSYVFAWSVIVTCTGLMYGFQAVALPLTIGIGCGVLFGGIVGIFTVKIFDTSGKFTLWNFLNQVIERLDPNGTRQIVLSVAVTVLLAASVLFPYVMGAVFGLFIGNQVVTKISTGKNLGSDPAKQINEKEKLKQDILAMQVKIDLLNSRMDKIKNTDERERFAWKIEKMHRQLYAMHEMLDRIFPEHQGQLI